MISLVGGSLSFYGRPLCCKTMLGKGVYLLAGPEGELLNNPSHLWSSGSAPAMGSI